MPADPLALLKSGDCITLYFGDKVKDKTIFFKDETPRENTWQRQYDGSNVWVLKDGTKGPTNGEFDGEIRNFAKCTMKAAFNYMLNEWQKNILDLSGIPRVIINFIRYFLDNFSADIQQVVTEATLFIEVKNTSLNFRLGFMIEGGENVAALIRWLSNAIETYISNLTHPG